MKPPKIVNVHAAKTHLSALLSAVQDGEEIIIAKAGTPVAKLTRVQDDTKPREFGWAKGRVWVAPDFDTYIPPGFEEYM